MEPKAIKLTKSFFGKVCEVVWNKSLTVEEQILSIRGFISQEMDSILASPEPESDKADQYYIDINISELADYVKATRRLPAGVKFRGYSSGAGRMTFLFFLSARE